MDLRREPTNSMDMASTARLIFDKLHVQLKARARENGIVWYRNRLQRLPENVTDAMGLFSKMPQKTSSSHRETLLSLRLVAAQILSQCSDTPVERFCNSEELQNPRLQFRDWNLEDANQYAKFLDDDELWRYMPEHKPETMNFEIARSLIEMCNTFSDRHVVKAVCVNGQAIGQARLEFSEYHDSAEISYWISEEWRGTGLGLDLVQNFTDWAWKHHLELFRIIALVHARNSPSLRILDKAGYNFESMDYRQPGVSRQVLTKYRCATQ